MIAARHDNDAVFQLLIKGRDMSSDMLVCAAECGAAAILRRLMQMGVDINSRRKSDGATALHVVKTIDAARILTEAKADPMLVTTDEQESVLYSQVLVFVFVFVFDLSQIQCW